MEWFLDKVGEEERDRLLIEPMGILYKKYEPDTLKFFAKHGRSVTNKTTDDYWGEAK